MRGGGGVSNRRVFAAAATRTGVSFRRRERCVHVRARARACACASCVRTTCSAVSAGSRAPARTMTRPREGHGCARGENGTDRAESSERE